MIKNQDFQKVSELTKGELVFPFPGTNFVMPYERGYTHINNEGTIACAELEVTSIDAKESGEDVGLVGALGKAISRDLNIPLRRAQIKGTLCQGPVYIFLSRIPEKNKVLTMPGLSSGDSVDSKGYNGDIVAMYAIREELSDPEKVCSLHLKAVGDRALIRDRSLLEEEIRKINVTANEIYDKSVKIFMASMGGFIMGPERTTNGSIGFEIDKGNYSC